MKKTTPLDYSPFADSELHSAEGLIFGDKPLTPKMISSLMHVDVTMHSTYVHEGSNRQRKQGHSILYLLLLSVVSVLIAFGIAIGFLYLYNIGPFFDSEELIAR